MIKLKQLLQESTAYKRYMAQKRWWEKYSELAKVKAELEKQGKLNDPEFPKQDPYDTSPYEHPKPPIVPGSGETEWKNMTARDVFRAVQKAKLRKKRGLPPEKDDIDPDNVFATMTPDELKQAFKDFQRKHGEENPLDVISGHRHKTSGWTDTTKDKRSSGFRGFSKSGYGAVR